MHSLNSEYSLAFIRTLRYSKRLTIKADIIVLNKTHYYIKISVVILIQKERHLHVISLLITQTNTL